MEVMRLLFPLPALDQEILHNFLFRMGNIHQREHRRQLAAVVRVVVRGLDDHLPQRQGERLASGIGEGHLA